MIHFDLAQKQSKVEALEAEMVVEGFWDDHKKSAQHIQTLNQIKKIVESACKHMLECSSKKTHLIEEDT